MRQLLGRATSRLMELDGETLEMLLLLLPADGEGQTAEELMAALRRWVAAAAGTN